MNQYWTWLREQTRLREIDEWIEITTPYLDRHNDYLQIYVKRSDGGFVLTDDGYVLEDLEQSGCKIDSDKRQALLKMTLNGFGIQIQAMGRRLKSAHQRTISRCENITSCRRCLRSTISSTWLRL